MAGETRFRAPCACCGHQVAVKINVSGKAYYTCDECGVKVQHTWQKSSDAYVAKHTPKAAPQPAPAAGNTNPPPKTAPQRQGAGTVLG